MVLRVSVCQGSRKLKSKSLLRESTSTPSEQACQQAVHTYTTHMQHAMQHAIKVVAQMPELPPPPPCMDGSNGQVFVSNHQQACLFACCGCRVCA